MLVYEVNLYIPKVHLRECKLPIMRKTKKKCAWKIALSGVISLTISSLSHSIECLHLLFAVLLRALLQVFQFIYIY